MQVFDSWVGCLSPGDYAEYVLPHVQSIFRRIARSRRAADLFWNGHRDALAADAEGRGDVLGVDWRVQLDEAWATVGYDVAIQGNLDPVALFAPLHEIERRVQDILQRADARAGTSLISGMGFFPTPRSRPWPPQSRWCTSSVNGERNLGNSAGFAHLVYRAIPCGSSCLPYLNHHSYRHSAHGVGWPRQFRKCEAVSSRLTRRASHVCPN